MFRTYCLSLLLGVLPLSLLGQSRPTVSLQFVQDSAYLGAVPPEAFPVRYAFQFRVVGQMPVRIQKVWTDCACTDPVYPQVALQPGDTASVVVGFDPYKAGPFRKGFTVVTERDSIQLRLAGFIAPFDTDPGVVYPHAFGPLQMEHRMVNLGSLTDEGAVKRQVAFYNPGKQPISIDSVGGHRYLEWRPRVIGSARPQIAPGQVRTFSLFYHPELHRAYGLVTDSLDIYLRVGGSAGKYLFRLPMRAVVRPKAALEDAASERPRLVIAQDTVDLGQVRWEEVASHPATFTLRNTGKAPLQVFRVEANYGCEVRSAETFTLPAGREAQVQAIILNNGREGRQPRWLTLYTNDPAHPTKRLVIKVQTKR